MLTNCRGRGASRSRVSNRRQNLGHYISQVCHLDAAMLTDVVSREQLLRLFNVSQVGSRNWLGYLNDEEERPRRPQRSRREPPAKEPVPNPEGQKLMFSGNFGSNERRTSRIVKDTRIARRLLERELGGHSYGREKVETPLMKQVSKMQLCW
jgi:hypothetical protein